MEMLEKDAVVQAAVVECMVVECMAAAECHRECMVDLECVRVEDVGADVRPSGIISCSQRSTNPLKLTYNKFT